MKSFFREYACQDFHPMPLAHRYSVNGKVSGHLAALMEIERCIPILHGPAGCAFHYRRSMRTRLHPFYDLESDDLRDSDVVFGGAESLMAALKGAAAKEPDLIAVLPSCTSDIINDDMDGIVREFRARHEGLRSRVLVVHSSVFSHPDKISFIQRMKERVHEEGKPRGRSVSKVQFRGCGFVEVMEALVAQIMEPQSVVPGTVNIESFGWGYGGREKMQEMIRLLARMGIHVNTLLPTASCAQIAAAPRAGLNIVRRIRWAQLMKEQFGTSYLHVPNMQEWYGLEGIRIFYQRIAEGMGRENAAVRVLDAEEKAALPIVREAESYLGQFRYGLMTSALGAVPEYIRLYEQTYHMPLGFICLQLPADYAEKSRLDEETLQKMRTNIDDALREVGSDAVFLLDPTEAQLRALLPSVDCLVGDGLARYEALGCPTLSELWDRRPLSMRSYARVLQDMAQAVARRKSRPHLLLSRIAYSRDRYPLLDEPYSLASREMWDRMWRMRG